jgi:hypothetical protein
VGGDTEFRERLQVESKKKKKEILWKGGGFAIG